MQRPLTAFVSRLRSPFAKFLDVSGRPVANREGEKLVTPAVRALEAAGVAFTVHEFEHVSGQRDFGREAAAALALDPDQVFKTLVVTADAGVAVAIVPIAYDQGRDAFPMMIFLVVAFTMLWYLFEVMRARPTSSTVSPLWRRSPCSSSTS